MRLVHHKEKEAIEHLEILREIESWHTSNRVTRKLKKRQRQNRKDVRRRQR